MEQKKINCAIGADHRGFALKKAIMENNELSDLITWHDVGAHSTERSDYPIYTQKAIEIIQSNQVQYAILLCGTGIGMSIAANRTSLIYAGVVWCPEIAQRAKEEDNMNVLIFPADYIEDECAFECIVRFLNATFKGGRYADRLSMIEKSGVK